MISQEIQEILKRAGTWDSYKQHHKLDEAINVDIDVDYRERNSQLSPYGYPT